MKYISFIFILLTIFVSCSDHPVTPHPTPTVMDTEFCSAAETNLKKIGCISANAPFTKKGKSFSQFCEETQNNGIFLNPKCLATITSCDKEDICTKTKTE